MVLKNHVTLSTTNWTKHKDLSKCN